MTSQTSLQTLAHAAGPRVLACGAWLNNTACLLDGTRARWSPLHGDLNDPEHCAALEASTVTLLSHSSGPVAAVAHDLQPDYFSTHVAQRLAQRLGVPAVPVQHHHAHIAALQAEHGLVEPVIGLALDGGGYGADAKAWGGELLWVQGAIWQRLGHLHPLALPGGEASAREPWRMTAAALHALGRGYEIDARFSRLAGATAAGVVQILLARDTQCPTTTSAGRWFDAAAGALGLGARQAGEGLAARALEQAAAEWLKKFGLLANEADAPLGADGGLDLRPLLARLLHLADGGAPDTLGRGAALFHITLADGLARWAVQAAKRTGVRVVALGGDGFANRLLVQRLVFSLQRYNPQLRVVLPQARPCGDEGLALGQAWVAAHGIVQAEMMQADERACV